MTKKRTKILISTALIALVMIALAVTMVFAYIVVVDYNYNINAHESVLTVGLSNATTVSVTRSGGDLRATETDIIVVASDDQLTLNGHSASAVVAFKHFDGNTYYKLVFKNMPLSGSSTNFSASSAISATLKAAIVKAEYTGQSDIKEVIYENKYVSSVFELELLNFQSNYNNIFELAGNYYGKIVYARTVYILSDLTIENELVINQPCSVNILNSKIVLNADLTLHHSYAGRYFLEKETAGAFGTGVLSGTGNVSIKTPKAYYRVNGEVKTALASRLIEVFDFDKYGDLVLTDALDFAQALIPAKVFSDLILQPQYQTYGVQLSYYILGSNPATVFTGGVSSDISAPEGSLYRAADSQLYTIRIYASKGSSEVYRDVEVDVVGRNAQSIVNYLADTFFESFTSFEGKIFSAINLLPLFKEVYQAGGYTSDITMSISESEDIDLTDENAARLMLNGSPAIQQTVGVSDIGTITSFLFRRGTVTVSDEITVTFNSNSVSVVKTLGLSPASNVEVMYYLKTSSPAFITNKSYGFLNIGGIDGSGDGIYLGLKNLTASDLGLEKIEYDVILIGETDIEVVDTDEYFELLAATMSLALHLDIYTIPDNLFFRYTCTFKDGSKDTFMTRIILSFADDGGENQQFESNNPFDELFMSTDTNWLEGGTFEVPLTAEINYARITILTVDGDAYNPSYHKMCYISNDLESDNVDDGMFSYFKRISFVTDLKYVPDRNSVVKVSCEYYAFSDQVSDVVLTQEYTITINGIFKCGTGSQGAQETPYVFSDDDFYDMTMTLIENYFPLTSASYVSELSTGERILLSDSSYARMTLNYSLLQYEGEGINTKGIERLVNVSAIILDGIKIADMSSFRLTVGSALKTLSLAGCKLPDSALYASSLAEQSYLFEIQLNTVILSGNSLTRTDKLISRTVKYLDMSNQSVGMDVKCLTDIAGLDSVKDLVTLDISGNAIYRFEVLKNFNHLKTVYLYNNRLGSGDFTAYGTDGLINIPHYVWLIKTNSVKIFASADNLSPEPATAGYIILGPYLKVFSAGGNITKDMQEGSVSLNAFASPTKLYSAAGKAELEHNLANLVVVVDDDGASGGVDDGSQDSSRFLFRFYNPQAEQLSGSFVLIDQSYNVTTSVTVSVEAGQIVPDKCSYIVAIIKDDGETQKVIAMREFLIDVYYNYAG